MPRTPDQIVRMEVHYCASYLVSTLANASQYALPHRDVDALAEQALELCSPIDDWEEAALQALEEFEDEFGVKCWRDNVDGATMAGTAQEACEFFDIEPYQREVFEHWIVSDWLADQLEARGEKVDRDFAGMIVWARATSGQGIASDSVIEAIAADLNRAA